jgi:hypothetical protein
VKAKDNPFAAQRIERLAFRFPDDDDWDALLARLESAAWRGAIVGPHGAGKTTVLEQLAPRLAARGFNPKLLTLRAESTSADKQMLAAATSARAPDFLLLDGAEQLTTRQWLTFQNWMRTAAGCVITLHRESRLPTVLQVDSSPALLDELTHELCGAWLPEGEARRLFIRHHGNLRECLRELYDRWAG